MLTMNEMSKNECWADWRDEAVKAHAALAVALYPGTQRTEETDMPRRQRKNHPPETPTEADVLRDVRLALGRMSDVVLWRNSVGLARGERTLRYGLAVGSADLVGVGPGGRFLALECKRPGGRLSRDQLRWGRIVERHGGVYAIVTSVRDAESVVALMRRAAWPHVTSVDGRPQGLE